MTLLLSARIQIQCSIIKRFSLLPIFSSLTSKNLARRYFLTRGIISVYSFSSNAVYNVAKSHTVVLGFPRGNATGIIISPNRRLDSRCDYRIPEAMQNNFSRRFSSFSSLYTLSQKPKLLSSTPFTKPHNLQLHLVRKYSKQSTSPSSNSRFSHLPHLPHLPHTPTRAEIIASANGFLSRIRLRIRLALTGQPRPWTFNDIIAMTSWALAGNALWILAGTTSFFSLVLLTANTLQVQNWIARRVGNYLTSQTGFDITFESAIVPKWKDGTIRFTNVRVARMPADKRIALLNGEDGYEDAKAFRTLPNSFPTRRIVIAPKGRDDPILNTHMWIDVTLDSVDVTLSLWRWLDGKGLLESASVKGVRGVIDRRHITWDPNITYNPADFRTKNQPGDFELERFELEDAFVTIYQPNNFRPFTVSIFKAELDRLRKQWIFYDMMCAQSIVGSFDGSLFSVYASKEGNGTPPFDLHVNRGKLLDDVKRKSHLRMNDVNIDHLNAGDEGPFGWIHSATIDLNAELYIPEDPADPDSSTEVFRHLVHEISEKIDESIPIPVTVGTGSGQDEHRIIFGGKRERGSLSKEDEILENKNQQPKFVMNIDLRFNGAKASVPLVPPELSYVSNAMIRPVVAYINRNRTTIALHCLVAVDLSNFDGAWTFYDSTLMDTVSEQVGKAFVHLTMDQQERNRRLKRVGLWGLHEVMRNLVNMFDYVRGTRGFWHYVGERGIVEL